MKNLYQVMLMLFLTINIASANQCTFNSTENKLIKRTIELENSSPFFKKNDFLSYKSGSWDIDTEDFYINPTGNNQLKLTGNSWKSIKLKDWFIVKPNSHTYSFNSYQKVMKQRSMELD